MRTQAGDCDAAFPAQLARRRLGSLAARNARGAPAWATRRGLPSAAKPACLWSCQPHNATPCRLWSGDLRRRPGLYNIPGGQVGAVPSNAAV